jgi:hypothetical protein
MKQTVALYAAMGAIQSVRCGRDTFVGDVADTWVGKPIASLAEVAYMGEDDVLVVE